MSIRPSSRGAQTAWRLLFATALLLVVPAAHAQTWERLPLVRLPTNGQKVYDLGFLRGEGQAANDPSADSLVAIVNTRTFLYNPSGAAGAAGDNGEWGAWHVLCNFAACGFWDVLRTSSNTLLLGDPALSRSTDRGRTWTHDVDDFVAADPLFESALPGLAGPAGERGLVAVTGDEGNTYVSHGDGAPGTWTPAGSVQGFTFGTSFGEVPPSAALPSGRLLVGVWNGVMASTDGGASYQPTSLYQQGGYIAHSFAFVEVARHPYGGVAFAGVDHAALAGQNVPRAEVHRSDDGGQTWTLAHLFTPEETGLPPIPSDAGPVYMFSRVMLAPMPDGALWAAVHYNTGPTSPGVILRSLDLGATWSRADAGFEGFEARAPYPASTPEQPFGWRVQRLVLSRTGVLYAATDRGVWRTTQPVVAAEAWPTPASVGLALSVAPNPSSGAVTLSVSSREAQLARVSVVDAVGREVWSGEAYATPSGQALRVEASSWASGVYVARASVGRHTEHVTVRFTVAR